MRLGLYVGQFGPDIAINFDLILEAERLGYSSVWTAEAYGNDAITPLSFIAYGRPLTRTREYVSIVRQILARENRLEHSGYHYQIPYSSDGATGLGKPLKSILHGRVDMKIYTAAISPRGLACSGEVADGVIPVWMDPGQPDLIVPFIEAGFAQSDNPRSMANFDLAPLVTCIVGDDLERCRRPVKSMLALYIGGMGARGKNFYNDYAVRLGYEAAAARIQDLYLSGKKGMAVAAVPDGLVDAVALVGPKERIGERIEVWKQSPATTLLIGAGESETLQWIAELVL